MIRKTTDADYEEIAKVYAIARDFMKASGNPSQWGDSRPLPEAIKKDIANGDSYVIEEDGEILGVFSFPIGDDETYHVIEEGSWLNNEPYGVIHKIASAGKQPGVLKLALAYAESKVSNVRIDTHRDNKVMQHLLEKYGYSYCGIIYTDDGTERLAYQKIIAKG